MNAFVLHEFDDRAAMARWGVGGDHCRLHAALIALGMAWYTHAPPPGVALPTIMIDLATRRRHRRPACSRWIFRPGPEMREADRRRQPNLNLRNRRRFRSNSRRRRRRKIPSSKRRLSRSWSQRRRKPEPAKIVPDQPKPIPVKPKPVRAEVKKPTDARPAPRSSAAPKAERHASLTPSSAPAGAISAAALASYNQLVAAHLQRFKQYPSGAKAAGEQGTARLSFTLGRSGQVLGSRLGGSSGHPALDGETLAMVRRAQPFPPMPPELKQASMSFSIPVQFSIR
jgi:protein TonB